MFVLAFLRQFESAVRGGTGSGRQDAVQRLGREWKGMNLFWGIALGWVFALWGASVDAAETPNVLLILADDLGYGDVRCYNPQSKVETPHLDRLAREGLRMTDAHSPCTVCTPTRYSLMTGQFAFRVPRGGTVFTGAGGPSLIAPDRLTLPEMLRQCGYATACVGKWHVGMTFFDEQGQPIHQGGLEAVQKIDYSRAIQGGPLEAGFDTFFGTACCPTTDWLYAFIHDDRVLNPPTQQLDRGPLPKHPYANDNRPGMVAPDFDLEEVDIQFLRKSQAYLKDHVTHHPDQPFFLYHCTQAVHLPSFPGDQFKGKTPAGPHGDFIFELDWVVGQLLQTLEELGVADNTLVIFTSDNGPETTSVYHMREDHQHDGARPWRGVKRDNWEGGHRVPMIIRWPGMIAQGQQSDALTCLTDVMATIAEIVEFELPNDAAEDSQSLLPIWKGQESQVRDYVIHQGFGGERWLAIRQGPWKLLAHQGSGGNRYEGNRWLSKYQLPDTSPDSPGQLYQLSDDPGETTNLYAENPRKARELEQLLEQSKAQGRSVPRR
jgi:arylsulfatase A